MTVTTPIFVICHTVLNDAFREYSDADDEKKKQQKSAKFLIKYLIEKSVINIGNVIAITSEQVMSSLDENLPNQGVGGYRAQILMALRNLILTIDTQIKNINESVIIISDLLSSRIENVILISNMKKKIRHTLDFYQKYEKSSRKWKEEDIPFEIKDTVEIEKVLRETDKETCDMIDSRI